jgi:hypothetical protein
MDQLSPQGKAHGQVEKLQNIKTDHEQARAHNRDQPRNRGCADNTSEEELQGGRPGAGHSALDDRNLVRALPLLLPCVLPFMTLVHIACKEHCRPCKSKCCFSSSLQDATCICT